MDRQNTRGTTARGSLDHTFHPPRCLPQRRTEWTWRATLVTVGNALRELCCGERLAVQIFAYASASASKMRKGLSPRPVSTLRSCIFPEAGDFLARCIWLSALTLDWRRGMILIGPLVINWAL